MNLWKLIEKKAKKVLVLVKCPKCRGAFYIDQKELRMLPKQICRLCYKQVKLEEV